ncbi:hypothetical protein [Klebsiella pneumoniae]|uniref:hypothetical protein n=1 Tax=Klebsiella pneumoniae TaxID=573 RepID=UPI003985A8C7
MTVTRFPDRNALKNTDRPDCIDDAAGFWPEPEFFLFYGIKISAHSLLCSNGFDEEESKANCVTGGEGGG